MEVGDIVLEERPVVWGPKQLSPVCCVACCRPLLFCSIVWCSSCSLPLCSQTCPLAVLHLPECQMMSHARDLLILNSDKDVQQVYYFLTVLRCLWLRDNLPNQWAAVLKLVSNLEQRRGTRVYNFNQTYVVDTLEHFGVNQFSELEIQTVCGIFDSNAFESSESSRAPCRGLYLMSSLINSSCLPNTRHYFKADGRLVVVATRPIYPGGEILGCYTHPRWATPIRQRHLLSTKYFKCSCVRCEDPAECGTLCSALRCPRAGCAGPVLGAGPGRDWVCSHCGAAVLHRKVVTTNNCGSQLVHTRDSDLNSTLAVLDKLSMWFHPRHYTITEVKMSVIKEWGGDNVSGDQTLSSRPHNKDLLQIPFHSLSQKNLELKLNFCEELESSTEIIEGSLSRTKGYLIMNYLKTLDYMKQRGFPIGQVKLHLTYLTHNRRCLQERMKRIPTLKKELSEIFKNDAGAPENYDIFTSF